MEQIRRAVNVVVPLVLGTLMLILAVPAEYLGPLGDKDRCTNEEGRYSCKSLLIQVARRISVSEMWGMYAPGPQRAHSYMLLTAIEPDGTERALEENEVETEGWGTTWVWEKNRIHILHHAVGYFRANKPSRNRTWFLRGICVREYRAGYEPIRIRMDRIRRRFTKPSAVRKGKPVLTKPERLDVATMGCRSKLVRDMIKEDRARREG
jgi:hypothetical protein